MDLLLWAYPGLPWAYFCERAHHWVYCSGPIWAYLGPTFANDHIIGFIALGLLGPTVGLPLPASKSLGLLLWGYLLLWAIIGFLALSLLGPT